jgi:tetratricopeptide (TPR) repeat protein
MAKKKRSGSPSTETRPEAAPANANAGAGANENASPDTNAAEAAGGAAEARPATGELPALTPELTALVDRLRGGRCVLCAGSRLLPTSGYRALVEKLLSTLPGVDASDARRVLAQRPLAAAGFVRRRLGERFAGELREATASAGELPETVRLLGELPFRAVITTSYDDSYERAFARDGALPKVYTPRDAAELKKDGKARFVLKALGDPARADTVVWSAEDLQGALADGGYRTVTHDLYRSRSFLFVGFDGEDPDLSILLDRVLAGAHAGDTEHYAILPGISAIEREELWAAYRIRVLDDSDVSQLARTLKDAIGDQHGPALPDDDDLDGWLALLTEEPGRADALDHLDKLERKLRAAADHERLVELHLGRVAVEPEAGNRAHRLLEVARLFENEVGDLGKAFTALLAGYKEDPQPSVWSELERLTSATGTWTELLSELAEVVPHLPEAERAEAWVRIARLYSDKLNHLEYALTSLAEALKLAPDLASAQDMRVALLRKGERWKELAEALGQHAARESVAARQAELFVEQADLYESRLGDGAQAIACYKKAVATDPDATQARGALEQILRRRGDWAELVAVLDDKAAHAVPEEAIVIRRELAELVGERLGDRRGAIARYEALRKDSPQDLQTLRALERLYDQEGNHDAYLGVLASQAEAVESDRERAALYRRMAAEWEESPGGGPRAAEVLEKLIALDARSEDAFRSLERLYRAERKWESLIDVSRRHATIVPPPIRGEIFANIGAIYEQELRDAPRAIEAYLDVEASLPNHAEALVALTRLYERTEAWEKTVELLERRAALAEVRSQRVELYHKAGEITAERLGDAKTAEARFVRALEVDATHVPSMTALVEIYRKHGEFLKAAKLLVEAVPHTQNRLERTRLLVEAAEIYQGLEDRRKATDLYLDALNVDPEHVEAADRVSELLWSAERYADLVPILEMLTRKEAEPPVQIERLVRLARAAKALGAADKVLRAYNRASELDPQNLEAQRGRADLLLRAGEYQDALAALTQVQLHHFEDLPPSERVELYFQLGTCELKVGNKDRAKNRFEKALLLDPTHRPALLAMMEFGEAKPESMIDAKKGLVLTAMPEEKVRLLTEIGDLYLEKLKDAPLAVGAYREALEIRPEERKVLYKCLEVYVEQKQWPQALEMLERLIDVEKDVAVRAKYRHTAGLICVEELGRTEQAVKLLSESLDDDPSLERSAEALEALLKERQDWKELARYYRKALKRLGAESPNNADGKNPERLRLWSAIGEVCLDKLGERETALTALEVALTFDRGNIERHKQLADLYVQAGPDRFDKAIVEHQILLRAEKQRVVSYRALKNLYIQTGQRDKAAACSYALLFLKKHEPDDGKVVAEQKNRAFATARRALTEEMWARLTHPEEDRFLDAAFALAAPAIAVSLAQPHKALGLVRKEALALDAPDARSYAKGLRYVTATFGVPAPETYVRFDQKETLTFANAIDKQTLVPVYILGQALTGEKRPERELTFELARRAAHLRPERFLRNLLPTAGQLAQIVDAVMALGEEPAAATADARPPSGETGKTAQLLRRSLPPAQLEHLVQIGRKLRAAATNSEAAALAWLQNSDLTASRVGLVMSGDLETSARLLAGEPASPTALPATQRLLDLVWSSVTEELFAVRKHLGLM